MESRERLSTALSILQANRFMPFPVRNFDYRGKWLKNANPTDINRALKKNRRRTRNACESAGKPLLNFCHIERSCS